jgi:hypothetical protein
MLFPLKPRRPVRSGYWFAPKRFGFGATPATKAGWAATFAYVLAVGAILKWLPGHPAKIGAVLCLTAGFIVLCWKKTDGGWTWHWGD